MISTWTKIDPTKNHFHFYAISMVSDLFNAYVVSCEWGRIGCKKVRRKVEVFDFKADAITYIQQLEKLRLKHHYQIAD